MYRVIVSKDVIKESKKVLKPSHRKKLAQFFETLKEDPFPNPPYDVKPVKGKKAEKTNIYRFGIGDYRVFYKVYWEENLIVVTDIKPRESAYR
jgi:mRNA interferase RelE/StbE